MNKTEYEYLEDYYKEILYCRLFHHESKIDCYIFKSFEEGKRYFEKNNLKDKKWCKNSNTIFISEDCGRVLAGLHIKNIYLVSTDHEKTIDNLCKEAIKKGYNITYKKIQ